MGQHLHVMFVKIDPNLDSVERLQRFRRNESKAINVLAMIEVFSKQKQHQVSIDLIFILLSFINREDEPASVFVVRILPLGFDARLEVLEGINASELVLDGVTE